MQDKIEDLQESVNDLSISVVVAARNEEAVIQFCLAALFRQQVPVPYEVIVVDNGSTDSTVSIASRFPCKIINEPRPGQLLAKRAGIEAAKGSIVVILDADCVPGTKWLAAIHGAMNERQPRLTAVTCCYQYGALPWWARLFIPLSRIFFVGALRIISKSLPFVIGGNVAFRRDALRRKGGYPLSGGIAETELGVARKLRAEGQIRYLPPMRVWSSARRFHQGLRPYFVDYKFKQYILPYVWRRS